MLDLPENEEISDLGNDALHRAASAGNVGIIKYLLERGVDINVVDYNSVTPAELAAIRGKLNVLEYLAEKGANLESYASDDVVEKNSLYYAIYYKQLEVVQFLLKYGVKLLVPDDGEVRVKSADDNEIHQLVEAAKWADNVEDNTNNFDVGMRDVIGSRLIHRLSMEDDIKIKGNLLEKLKICFGCENTHYNHSRLKGFIQEKFPKNLSDKFISKMDESIEVIMSAPRKVRKIQSVKIRSMQSLTNGIEPTIALQEVTNVMKPVEGTYQAATQVKVLNPEIPDIIEVDVFHGAEDSMKDDAMVSYHSLYRGRSPWHDMRWSLRKLGRSSVFSKENARTSQNRQGNVKLQI